MTDNVFEEPLVVGVGKVPGTQRTKFETFSTLASARTWLTECFSRGWGHQSYPESARQVVAEAVAAKEGKDVETVLQEAQERAARRR